MTTCIILHNMIIKDECDLNAPIQDVVEVSTPTIEMAVNKNLRFEQFLGRHKKKLRTKVLILNSVMH
ncbi:hypothetical protein EJD97_018854 [Solanum chilense]|uniref:Uncharacterized protein n=1 Tax=Solanum chilense TaxID=4083 RepID=A0A6N2AGL3_SOLCI|nr:hypothetical protein EJD97_018854 [Solanum chilense]